MVGTALGEFGAEVIKVEPPGAGDPMRTWGNRRDGIGLVWKSVSRNKRCVTCDLRQAEGQRLFHDLLDVSDVLVVGNRPSALERWGIDYESVHAAHPSVVMLHISGYGRGGPKSDRPGYGTLAEAMSGFAHQTGQEDGPPTLPPFGLADGVAGISGALAVLMALYHRETSGGSGQVIDLSLIEPLLGILGPGPSVYDQLGIIAGRHGNRSPNNAPRNAYLTADDRWVAISASATSVAERVMRLVGRPDIAEKPWFASAGERVVRGELIDRAVAKWIHQRKFDEVVEAFQEAGAALAPIYDIEQLMEDPQILARESITTIQDEDLGPLKMQNLFFRMQATPGRIRFGGRRLGQDNDEVYAGLGLDGAERARLRSQDVV